MYDLRKQIEAKCDVVGAEEFYTHLIMFVCVAVLGLGIGAITSTAWQIMRKRPTNARCGRVAFRLTFD